MSNDDLISQILGAVGPDAIQSISGQIGAPPQQTANAVQVALPMILGALGKNATQPGGADAIHSALQQHSGLDLGSVLGSVLGGGGDGAGILGHVLGGRQTNAASGISQASGLGQGQAMKLMMMLAPIVMAYLGNRSQQAGMTPQGLGGLLGQQHQQIAGGGGIGGTLMNAVLDKDGDGDVDFSDILAAASGATGGNTGAPQQGGGIGGLLGSIFGKN